MPSSVHRKNTTFQIRYFIAGQCHTVDGAWAALFNQKTDIESKLSHAEAQRIRRQAAITRAQATIDDPDATDSDRLDAQADRVEKEADIQAWERNVQGAQNELDAIKTLMSELEPYRKYADHGPLEASELAQHDEWREELKTRAENFQAANVLGIPWDHLQTMRSHPDFHEKILPHMLDVRSQLQSARQNGDIPLVHKVLEKPNLFPEQESE